MKTLLMILLLIPLFGLSQNATKYPIYTIKSNQYVGGGKITPTHNVIIKGEKSDFVMNFSGDSMVVSGDIKLDKAAQRFIEFCKFCYKSKIDSMQFKIDSLRLKILNDPWNRDNPKYKAR